MPIPPSPVALRVEAPLWARVPDEFPWLYRSWLRNRYSYPNFMLWVPVSHDRR